MRRKILRLPSFYQRSANHVSFYLFFNLRNLLYLIPFYPDKPPTVFTLTFPFLSTGQYRHQATIDGKSTVFVDSKVNTKTVLYPIATTVYVFTKYFCKSQSTTKISLFISYLFLTIQNIRQPHAYIRNNHDHCEYRDQYPYYIKDVRECILYFNT